MLLVIMCVIMVIGATENKNEKELTKMKNEKIKEMMRAMVYCLLKENESFKNTAATIAMMTTTKMTTPIPRRRLLLVKKNENTTTATTNDEKTIFRMMIKNGGDEKKTGTERKKGGDGEKKKEETLLRREGNAWPALLTQIRSINIFLLHHHHLWRTT